MDDVATPDPRSVLDAAGIRPAELVDVVESLRGCLAAEVEAVLDEQRRPDGAIPQVDYDSVAAGTVAADVHAAIAQRGVVIVRDTFDREQAERWDREVADYLRRNRFDERFSRPDRSRKAPGARIWGVYWSRPQVAARQHERMVMVRRFLNGFWSHRDAGGLDRDHDIGYPDRIRRRPPGTPSGGLPLHTDSPATAGWRLTENWRVYGSVLAGDPDRHDPWDATHRTGRLEPSDVSSLPSTVFRAFQGWTALSEMRPDDGGLHTIPIPSAACLTFVEGLAGELGLLGGDPAPAATRARPTELLTAGAVPMPTVEPGDTVWWHGDVFHSVAEASNRKRWSNVMYIGAAPRCPRNDEYARSAFERFVEGRSPVDFPPEDVEVDFEGRAGIADLDEVGRRQFGLEPVETG